MTKLEELEIKLEGLLGAIMAHKVKQSRESSKVIRNLTKLIESLGVPVRKELVELDKTLVSND